MADRSVGARHERPEDAWLLGAHHLENAKGPFLHRSDDALPRESIDALHDLPI
jgi:hypothetical protein